MGLVSRVKVWVKEKLTFADLNAEFDNVLNNLDPDGVEDASVNTAAMQAVADPYPGSVESLATSLRGELQRIRYLLKQITGEANWYVDPDNTIAAMEADINTNQTDIAARLPLAGGTMTGAIVDLMARYKVKNLINTDSPYTVLATDAVMFCDCTSGAITVAPPTAVGIAGRKYAVIKTDSSANAVTIDPNGTEKIDGATTYTLSYQYDFVVFVSNGTDWYLTSEIAGTTKPAFSAHRNSVNQAILSSTWTKVKLTTEEFDTNSNFEHDADDSGGATESRFTPTVAGKYLITAYGRIQTDAVTTNNFIVLIYKNGAAYKGAQDSKFYGSNFRDTGVSVVVDANGSTDYFEMYVYHTHASTKNLIGDPIYTHFTGCKID